LKTQKDSYRIQLSFIWESVFPWSKLDKPGSVREHFRCHCHWHFYRPIFP